MKAWNAMTMVGLCLASLPALPQAPNQQPKDEPLSLRLTDEVISKAVRETLAEQADKSARQPGKALSGDAYRKFERAFSEAEKPGCLHPDAMKFLAPGTVVKTPAGAFNAGVGGLFALPFWAAAIVRGKCN